MSERRYDGQEIEEIFRKATERSQTPGRSIQDGEGLTLDELQEIGEEVGISPERVADAASALDRPSTPVLPLSVRHTVSLPRSLTDEEWDQLVADLRSTFQASGKVRQDGGLKGWTNSNLHAFIEPTDSGYRLRMGTTRGQSRAMFMAGGSLLAVALVLIVVRFLSGDLAGALDGLAIVSLMGLGMVGFGAVPLPGWAATRRRQMEALGERLTASMEELPAGES